MVNVNIAVGSCNPVKVSAVFAATAAISAFTSTITSMKIDSGVSNQPMDRDETIKGALNRAIAAQDFASSQFGIGLESGIERVYQQVYCLSEYCCIVSSYGIVSFGGGTTIPLPNKVVEMIKLGVELGEIMDILTGMKNTKSNLGATGILTNHLINRQISYQMAVTYAFAPFLTTEFYPEAKKQTNFA